MYSALWYQRRVHGEGCVVSGAHRGWCSLVDQQPGPWSECIDVCVLGSLPTLVPKWLFWSVIGVIAAIAVAVVALCVPRAFRWHRKRRRNLQLEESAAWEGEEEQAVLQPLFGASITNSGAVNLVRLPDCQVQIEGLSRCGTDLSTTPLIAS
eukprot:NODE_4984_length_623_cov_228.529930.p2 GENE.NODE_4984_length_623_cov_228.529930~~NODE_4984_length_623_cov_228.529930.p2  ORF type:complete len:152 (-),score=16.04 NODE_4984_length_623_cov_228.529930:167-622(-)